MPINNNRRPCLSATSKVQSIDSAKPTPPNLPPAKSAFVPKCDREAWADVWLSGRASLMKLTRTNKGFGLLEIERAVLTEIKSRLRRAEDLRDERQASDMQRKIQW